MAAEQALIDRAANAPAQAFESVPAFAISSNNGLIFREDFRSFEADVNGNGLPDCDESFIGFGDLMVRSRWVCCPPIRQPGLPERSSVT